jgi:response regulator RpfG family c-di-GMP phosphodiesterase
MKPMPKILCLNDIGIALWSLDIYMEKTSYEHENVRDSDDALSILRQEPIDLLIQDIERPGMNGFELYWLMKSDKNLCDIPILVFSAWSDAKSPVKMTPAKIRDRMLLGLYRAEFEKTKPEHLSAVAHIKDANVLYLEGYLRYADIEKVIVTIEKILKNQTLLTEEERMFRHQYLWSQAIKS